MNILFVWIPAASSSDGHLSWTDVVQFEPFLNWVEASTSGFIFPLRYVDLWCEMKGMTSLVSYIPEHEIAISSSRTLYVFFKIFYKLFYNIF